MSSYDLFQRPTGLADGLRLEELPLLATQDTPHWDPWVPPLRLKADSASIFRDGPACLPRRSRSLRSITLYAAFPSGCQAQNGAGVSQTLGPLRVFTCLLAETTLSFISLQFGAAYPYLCASRERRQRMWRSALACGNSQVHAELL